MLDVPIKNRSDVGKLRIAEALERLLANRNIEELNVTKICKEAGISRQTFYRHFKDKYDIAQWVWTGITERYVREIGRSLTWDEAAMGIGRTCAGNALVLSNLMAPSSDYQAIPAYVERTVIGWFEETATKYHGAKLTPQTEVHDRLHRCGHHARHAVRFTGRSGPFRAGLHRLHPRVHPTGPLQAVHAHRLAIV